MLNNNSQRRRLGSIRTQYSILPVTAFPNGGRHHWSRLRSWRPFVGYFALVTGRQISTSVDVFSIRISGDNASLTKAGHSVGHWEGDTLVVETTGFLPGIVTADGRVPHGSNMRVTERFDFDPAKGALHRSYVAVNPEYFEGEYKGQDTVYVSALPYHGTTPCRPDSAK